MANRKWTLLFKVKDGHSYWRQDGTDLIALSDDSGQDSPDHAEDGVLWIDSTRRLSLDEQGNLAVPIYSEREERALHTIDPVNADIFKLFHIRVKPSEGKA